MLSVLILDNPAWFDVGQPIQAADPRHVGPASWPVVSRLKAGCGQDCPPHNCGQFFQETGD